MPPIRLATWNINSVRLRIGLVAKLAREQKIDVLCLQETKVADAEFPHKDIQKMGFEHVAINGQKGYHGVAILSRLPLTKIEGKEFCEKGDARHLRVTLPGDIEVHNFYVPAGGDIPDPEANDKFAHKLQFLDEMEQYFSKMKSKRTARRVVVGDLNVAPFEHDVWSHKQLLNIVSHTPVETERMARVTAAHDWIDVTRSFVPKDQKVFSWWSYRNQDWKISDRGRRLDHVWVSAGLDGAVTKHSILKAARDWERPSDHVPIVVEIEA
ncbi:MAG: exodeoxyribonuclease III [Alphaproteobacteria bacterium]|nr:exodeoxyribonuclease III [Alphaproteobacteria bacterium]